MSTRTKDSVSRAKRESPTSRYVEELVCHMTPEKRATFERICKLREKIGPIDFNVVKAIREFRGYDTTDGG